MPEPNKRIIPQRKVLAIAILGVLILTGLLGVILWKFALAPQEPAVIKAPRSAIIDRYAVPTYPGQEPVAPAPLLDQDRPPNAAITALVPGIPPDPEDECAIISRQIKDFFTRLDQRDYIQKRRIVDGSKAYFGMLIDRLLANPPVVSGETADLLTILNNSVHLYRVLQRDDLLLFKDVLINEMADLENIMALFYRWSLIAADCPGVGINIHLPLPAMYEYAGFFLNTLGGRSYLFRRATRVRLLVKYYSVLILDQVNEAKLNHHGLDIRPAINSLLNEMPGTKALQKRDQYLAVLIELQDKYRRLYGP